jgi:large subunit ribosomal protein L28
MFGNSIVRRGMAKKKGGVGQKITGITRRLFKPNIQRIRINDHGTVRRARVCASCIKAGKVTKAL